MPQKAPAPYKILANAFLEKAAGGGARDVAKALKTSSTYQIGKTHVLVRAATKSGETSKSNGRYFFGIHYITIEDLVNLRCPFVALICGGMERVVIIPAGELFAKLSEISRDKKGGYKIIMYDDLNIVLKGGGKWNCQNFVNRWDFLANPPADAQTGGAQYSSVEKSMHATLQGRLVEIGNIRGFTTFCPDKAKMLNNQKLGDLTKLDKCPELQYSDYDLLRKIDVIWFRNRGNNYIPECAFEVELSTGVWSGVGRMATLIDYANTNLYVIAEDERKYSQVMGALPENRHRYKYLSDQKLGELYAAEMELAALRHNLGV